MIKENIQQNLNNYLNFKLNSSYFFLNVSSYFAKNNKTNLYNFFKSLSQKELSRSMNLYEYIIKRSGNIELSAILKPTFKNNIVNVIQNISNQKRTSINKLKNLIEITKLDKDYATTNFLENFIIEEYQDEDAIRKLMK